MKNLFFVNEGEMLHQMNCMRNYDVIPLDEYEKGRLLELLLHFRKNPLPIMIGGDWQEQIITKLQNWKLDLYDSTITKKKEANDNT